MSFGMIGCDVQHGVEQIIAVYCRYNSDSQGLQKYPPWNFHYKMEMVNPPQITQIPCFYCTIFFQGDAKMSFSWRAKKNRPHQASRGCPGANREAVGISIQYAGNEIDTSPPGPQASFPYIPPENERKRKNGTQETSQKKSWKITFVQTSKFFGGAVLRRTFSDFLKR